MEKLKEEIMYCTSCGAVNKKSGVFCEECKKKIVVKHRPIVDFLKKRVKGKIAGEITESLFGLLKKYIYSHLYGLVLTVSVVATATVAATNATPYIKTVTEYRADSAIEEIETTEDAAAAEYASWCERYAQYLLSHYAEQSDAVVWAHEGYTVDENNLSLDEIYAERAIPGFNHRGVHEMMTVRVPLGMYHNGTPDSPRGMSEISDCVKDSLKIGENVVSPLGQTLYEEGYEVMECNYAISLYEGLDAEGTRGSVPVEKEEFRILMVRNGDYWYVAEDVLVERIKGETYDQYMLRGINGPGVTD